MKAPIYLLAAIMLLAASCGESNDDTNEPERFYAHAFSGLTLNDTTLTLNGISPQTLSTIGGPNPASGPISTEEFLTLWDEGENSFSDDPPKADITCTVDGEVINYVVELRMPELDGDKLTYAIEGIGDSNLPVSGTACTGIVAPSTTTPSQRKDVQQQSMMNAVTSTPENVIPDNWAGCLVDKLACEFNVVNIYQYQCGGIGPPTYSEPQHGATLIECLVVIDAVGAAIQYLIINPPQ